MNADLSVWIDCLVHPAWVVDREGGLALRNQAARAVIGRDPLKWNPLARRLGLDAAGARALSLPEQLVSFEGLRFQLKLDSLPGGHRLVQLFAVADEDYERIRWLRMVRRALDGVTDAIEITDLNVNIEYVNPAWERLFGYTRAEAVGRTPKELIRSDRHDDEHFAEIEEKVRRGEGWKGLVWSRNRKGDVFENELQVTAVLADDGTWAGFLGIRRATVEMRKRLELEKQLQRAEQLAALGRLAAGVAHEINNPLTYVTANLDYLGNRVAKLAAVARPERAELCAIFDETKEGAERIAHIVEDLQAFGRETDEVLQPVEIREACNAALKMVRNQIVHRANLVLDLDESVALAVEERLVQVLVNLLVNAAESIPLDGSTGHEVRLRSRVDGEFRVIVVEDTGCGIEPDRLEQIFDAFQTGKGRGGTGLGLAVCKRLVERMGGTIEVASKVGAGSTFQVRLRAGEFEPELPRTRDLRGGGPTKRLRVLIVDDEIRVGESLRRLMGDHDVLLATSGDAALNILDAAEFDGVMCDVMMPGMSGLEFFGEVRRRHPRLAERFVFMTGGAFVKEIRRELEARNITCLAKPLGVRSLQGWLVEMGRLAQ